MEVAIELFLLVTALSIVLNVIFKMFEIPTIIGYIVAGICFSQMYVYSVADEDEFEYMSQIAEFGVVFLMFSIGLEFSFKHLMAMKKDVFFNGILQVAGSGIIFALLLEQIFNTNIKIAVIIGLALSLSSTAIVLKIFNDTNQISQNYGRKALGILLFQDLAVIPILLMIDIFGSTDSTPINYLLLKTAISGIIVIVSLFLIGKFVFNHVLEIIVKTNTKEIFIATILFTVISASFLAHVFGFSYTLGAFIAGMLIAETKYKHEIEAELTPFRDILLGLFFITIGMQINSDTILAHYGLILIGILLIMTIKTAVIYAILILSVKKRVALKAGLSLSQIGEFALAIFAILMSKNMLSKENGEILITIVVVSMILTPFILKNINRFANSFENKTERAQNIELRKIPKLKDHIVICGYGRIGQEMVLRLKSQGLLYIVIENDAELVRLGKSRDEKIFQGNLAQKEFIETACLADAAVVILTISNEQKLELVAKAINAQKISTKIIVIYTGIERKKELIGEYGDNFIFIKLERVVAGALIQEALRCKLENI